jgi:ribose transport system substrate-binding protein
MLMLPFAIHVVKKIDYCLQNRFYPARKAVDAVSMIGASTRRDHQEPFREERIMGHLRKYAGVAIALAAVLTVGGCAPAVAPDQTNGSVGSADTARASELASVYLDGPSEFPVATPLETLPAGKRIAFIDCGTPICALFHALIEAPAAALGMEVLRIDAGHAADTVQAAFDAAIASEVDGVFVPGIDSALWERGLDDLTAAGIPVVTTGMTGGDAERIPLRHVSEVSIKRAADAMAGYVVAEQGADVNIVLYQTPELNFTTLFAEEFILTMQELCDSCVARTVDIPAAALGNRAPTIVADDLQAHPETSTALFGVGEQANGLTAALTTAGIDDREILVFIPGPETLQQTKDGLVDFVLGLDLTIIAWTTADTLAKLITGQAVDEFTLGDNPVMQFLAAEDLPADVSLGWTGYQDFPERFAALWANAK